MYIGKTRLPILVIVFSIITCGIYSLYWYYTIMNDTNKILQKKYLHSSLQVLLLILCPPIIWYVLYKVDKGLVEAYQQTGAKYTENFILWLLLSMLLGVGIFVAMVQITSAFNVLWQERSVRNRLIQNQTGRRTPV